MKADQFLAAARHALAGVTDERLDRDGLAQRAVGACYYAVFHTLCREASVMMMGEEASYFFSWITADEGVRRDAVVQAYRGLDHSSIRAACERYRGHPALETFAALFIQLLKARNEADYHPFLGTTVLEARGFLTETEASIAAFHAAPDDERRAFLVSLLFRPRR